MSLKTLNSRFWLMTLAAIIAVAITLKLGFWQQSRAHEKLALQASIQAQTALPSLDAAGLMRATSRSTSEQGAHAPDILHRVISLTGHWLPQHTLFLDNRQMDAKPGLFVLTPFEFEDTSTANKKVILVQRGWLPRNFLDRNKLPEVATESAQVTIVARIALTPSKLFEFKGADKGALRQNIEIEALAKEFKIELLPYSLLQLDQVDANAAKVEAKDQKKRGAQLLRNWSQPNFGSEKNYGYMVQWWALSALILLLYVWFQFIRPAIKSKNSENTSSHITKKTMSNDTKPSPHPLEMTVHSLPQSDAAVIDTDMAQRTKNGRWKMLMVLLLCASPVIASYFAYYVIRPEGRRNFGELINPQRIVPNLNATSLDGKSVNLQTLTGQWLLVSVSGGACDALCQKHLYFQRQLRESLGKEKDRLDWVWLVSDAAPIASAILPAMKDATVLRMPAEQITTWMQAAQGQQLADHLYLIDPMGNWMMRFPPGLDAAAAKKAKSDIDRVMRASASWDKAGR